jgi:hypothetical protein
MSECIIGIDRAGLTSEIVGLPGMSGLCRTLISCPPKKRLLFSPEFVSFFHLRSGTKILSHDLG